MTNITPDTVLFFQVPLTVEQVLAGLRATDEKEVTLELKVTYSRKQLIAILDDIA